MSTIVAISTGLSKSAINIVRMSGKDSLNIACNIMRSNDLQNNSKPITLKPRVATLHRIYDVNKNLLDRAIIIYFKSPNSYNGEDIVEIQSHGGFLIAQEILKTCIHYGAILARPGEFSIRAVRNNKMDLLQLQATTALINNTNANLTQLLVRNITGDNTKRLDSLQSSIVEVIAQIEAHIDYGEEDLDSQILNNSCKKLKSIESSFENILESTKKYNKLQDIKLSIIGKPNVGKSSILNLLLLQDRAIVSNIAGTTRDVITEQIDINGNLISISDTAGIRSGSDEIERQGIERSFEYAKKSEIILCVFDLSRELDNEDRQVLDFIQQDSIKDKNILIILNKNDLEKKNTYNFSSFNTIHINTMDREQRFKIKDKIKDFLTMNIDSDTLVLMNNMQQELLESTLNCVKTAQTLIKSNALELASYELTQALDSLSDITRPYKVEDILDSMFSQFCLGK